MTKPLIEPIEDLPAAADLALFLDFDGTLVEIEDLPTDVRLDSVTRMTLARLALLLDGAIAIVTGRDIADVDRFLHPVRLPVAGVHGTTRRDAAGMVHARRRDGDFEIRLQDRLRGLAEREAGILVEPKQGAVALHFRSRPELAGICAAAMQQAVHDMPGVVVIRGKMVIEAKVDASNKGDALAEFLAEPPFAGRLPVFAGDDVTDEDAFRAVNAAGGISIKVGAGETLAQYRAADTPAFLHWLQATTYRLGGASR